MKRLYEVVVKAEVVEAFEVEAENEDEAKHLGECLATGHFLCTEYVKAIDAYAIDGLEGDSNA